MRHGGLKVNKDERQPEAILTRLRGWVLALFLLGVGSTSIELLLLDHTESIFQWIPLSAIGLSLSALLWHAIARTPQSLRAFQVVLLLFIISGFVGIGLHYKGNVEFELEMYPSLSGMELFFNAITGATPAMAPGLMIQWGLLGFVYTYRHPSLQARQNNNHSTKE